MHLLTVGLLIAGICLLLAIVSLVSQAMEQRRAERRRVIAGLQRHTVHFSELLSGFPQGYLNKELEIFLCQNIIDTYEKLIQLDDKGAYQEILDSYRQNLKERIQSPQVNLNRLAPKTPAEIKDVKELLKGLLASIAAAQQNHSLDAKQAEQFKKHLNKTTLALNLDSFQIAALQAEVTDKFQVAIHYHEQAKKLLIASDAPDKHQKIEHYNHLIKALTEKMAQQAALLITQNLQDTQQLEGLHISDHIFINDASDPTKKRQLYE